MASGQEKGVGERDSNYLIESISNGSFTSLDGAVSLQTRSLMEKFHANDVDMTELWMMTPQNWICPACGRAKPDIVRLNKNRDLMCRLVEHHDHMKELLKSRYKEIAISMDTVIADELSEKFALRSASMVSSFDNTVVCDDCNIADINAKKAAGADRWFSFSPDELKRITIPRNNIPHEINESTAIKLWKENESTFALRLKVVNRIAEIAATNTHWFQPVSKIHHPDTVRSRASNILSHYGAQGSFNHLCGNTKRISSRDPSSWRSVKHKQSSQPPPNEIQFLMNKENWAKVPENWICPGCGRSKTETITKNKHGEWKFTISNSNWYYDSSKPYGKTQANLCNECGLVAQRLGKEAREYAGILDGPNSSLVAIQEISLVIISRPHSKHNIDNEKANELVEKIIGRLNG